MKNKHQRRRGHAIVEYAALLALLAIITALLFSFGRNKLTHSLSASFSNSKSRLAAMNGLTPNQRGGGGGGGDGGGGGGGDGGGDGGRD